MGLTIPFFIAFDSIFFIVLFNAFFTVDPRHPKAPNKALTGLNALSEKALNCASAARGPIFARKNVLTPSIAEDIKLPSRSSSKVLKFVVIPPTMSVSLLAVLSI